MDPRCAAGKVSQAGEHRDRGHASGRESSESPFPQGPHRGILRVVVAAKRPAAAWRSPASPRRAPAMLRRCSEEDATEAADDEEEGPGWSIRCSRRISSPREAKPSRAPRKLQEVTSLYYVHNPAYSTSFTSRPAEAGEAIRLLAIARTTPLLHPRSSAATRRAPAPERG